VTLLLSSAPDAVAENGMTCVPDDSIQRGALLEALHGHVIGDPS
jgi:hypothetical protein